MKIETKRLLGELAMIAIGQHQHSQAESIAASLSADSAFTEIVASIRSLSLMNRGQYQAALELLEPLASEHQDLICFIVLCADELGLATKLDFWLAKAAQSSSSCLQAFATRYQAP
ncbi:YscG family type III secretion protein [Shewanella sp.]|uniref:YscG family type III secretion protein n=1 Tax=Shewanella sp. TaxID=50422 RepID=UPI001ED198FE|nr:YscG family type III secretion protein [Shewanella sp.]NRB24699.1 YscG family type III secretion protein [Shewanella sp.]